MNLIAKYNVPAPRYTSYPTVPYWENNLDAPDWENYVKRDFDEISSEGLSLYIHLPYCESLCTYCGCNTRITVNHAVETPYIAALLKEWVMYLNIFQKKPRIKEIHIGGGTPTFFSAENLNFLIRGIISGAAICADADFSFEAHPNNTSVAHLKTLYSTGFRRLSVGVQDFDPTVQLIINRIQSFEQTKQVIDNAREIGYSSVSVDLVYGLPLQTLPMIIDTINKVIKLKPDRIAFYSYAHVPWVKPGQRKFTEADLPSGNEKRQLYEKGRELLIAAGYHEIGMDHFSLVTDDLYKAMLSNTLHRNFMGYTPRTTNLLIGLGVSAISNAKYAFAQNEKTVENYLLKVNSGLLPLLKGHVQSAEDLILQQHILNIMCRYQTSLIIQSEYKILFDQIITRLQEPLSDGLIILLPDGIQITEKGKPFLRNICMAFDARSMQNTTTNNLYSLAV